MMFIYCRHIITVFISILLPVCLFANSDNEKNKADIIELRNSYSIIKFSNKAELLSLVDLRTNKDIAAKGKKIAYVKTIEGVVIPASNLRSYNNHLFIQIGEYLIDLQYQEYHDFFSFEVMNTSLPGVDELTFLDIELDYGIPRSNTFCVAGIAMSLNTNPVYYPSCENKEIIGKCYAQTGIYGAKLGVVASNNNDFWDIVRTVYLSLPPYSVPVTYSSGGPFSKDSEANRYDCVIIGDPIVSPDNVPEWIDFYSRLGIRQIDFLLGSTTFTQGDFSFPGVGSAKLFKEQITDPLYQAGFISTLHSYSYYISPLSEEILSNPKWQQELEFRAEFLLAKDILREEQVIDVIGDLKILKDVGAYWSVYTPYMLIDNEIIEFVVGDNCFVSCKRGQCGTKAVSHKMGSKVKIIGGNFNYIAPVIGSDLFYEIARRTAIAYNEGGFRGFYFDAIDGMYVHMNFMDLNRCTWYYEASFINEVLKYCEKEPLVVELSRLTPTLWSVRGRGECWDTPNRGYKNFIDDHISRNLYLKDRQYVTTLGWYDFYPIRMNQPGNYMTKYMFFDDVDYLGVKAIAYDQTIVYNGLIKKTVESIPGLQRNLELYTQYNKLRIDNYFSDRVKNVLLNGNYEYKLHSRNEAWGFKEARYCRSKIRDTKTDSLYGVNPFKRQKPFIRVENLYTSDCSSIINLVSFNDSSTFSDIILEKRFESPQNLSDHLALRVLLRGNGINSKDALCIRLRSSESSGYADFVVNLSFEGWREVILPNVDNAESPNLSFIGMEDEYYQMHRFNVDFSKINYIGVFKTEGCKEVYIKNIDAVPLISNSIKNPEIRLGRNSVKFLDTILSGEYIEYQVGDTMANVYDMVGNNRVIDVLEKGRFKVPHGSFTASVKGESQLDSAPSEVVLTIGLYGKFICN